MVEWEDGDGWCKGKNRSGVEGYFPQSYVQPTSRPSSPGITMAPSSASDLSTPTQSLATPKTNGTGLFTETLSMLSPSPGWLYLLPGPSQPLALHAGHHIHLALPLALVL